MLHAAAAAAAAVVVAVAAAAVAVVAVVVAAAAAAVAAAAASDCWSLHSCMLSFMAHHVCPQSVFGGKGSSARLAFEGSLC